MYRGAHGSARCANSTATDLCIVTAGTWSPLLKALADTTPTHAKDLGCDASTGACPAAPWTHMHTHTGGWGLKRREHGHVTTHNANHVTITMRAGQAETGPVSVPIPCSLPCHCHAPTTSTITGRGPRLTILPRSRCRQSRPPSRRSWGPSAWQVALGTASGPGVVSAWLLVWGSACSDFATRASTAFGYPFLTSSVRTAGVGPQAYRGLFVLVEPRPIRRRNPVCARAPHLRPVTYYPRGGDARPAC